MTERKPSIQDTLIKFGACSDAREWAEGKTWPEIFDLCHRGDWLLWLFRRTNPDSLKELTRAKAHCALTVRHLMKDQRSIDACEVALKFADGLATREELNYAADAADAAYAAAAAADTTYAAAAAAAYAAAADAAADAAYAAAAAADTTYAAYAAAAYAAAADAAADAAYAAYAQNQNATADICRKYLPIEIWNL